MAPLGSLKIALILMAPFVIVYASAGGVAALAVAMGYTGSLTAALTLGPPTHWRWPCPLP